MSLSYQAPGLTLAEGSQDSGRVRDLQRDLRRLGYLPGGIDGDFGPATARAVRALQLDLINGGPDGHDGAPPLAIADANRDAAGARLVPAVTGMLDQGLARCIATLLPDARAGWLPAAADPAAANAAALARLRATSGLGAPVPFMLAMFQQESGCRQFSVPDASSDDAFVVVGLDRNDPIERDRVTSRGYGLGQYTFFHHPPRPAEVEASVLDAEANVRTAFAELRGKFDRFVAGPADTADDRRAEHPLLALRPCRYAPGDARYMQDCLACAAAAPKLSIRPGTPVHHGAALSYQPTQYYRSASYDGVPDRAAFGCDWPYAARRYNGSGVNSYHYQTIILRNLLAGTGFGKA